MESTNPQMTNSLMKPTKNKKSHDLHRDFPFITFLPIILQVQLLQ